MKAVDLTVLAPTGGCVSAVAACPWPDGCPAPYDALAEYEGAGGTWRTFRYTYPGGPESHAYLAVPDITDADLEPTGRYHGAQRWGPVSAIPESTLMRAGKFRLVIPGATAEEHAAIMRDLTAEPEVQDAPDEPEVQDAPDEPEVQDAPDEPAKKPAKSTRRRRVVTE